MTLTATQIEARRTGLGGSDASAAVGVSRYKTPLELYLEKRGEAPPFDGNERTKWGHALEPAIRQEYAERTGETVVLPEDTLRHAEIPFLLCHPDGITKTNRLLEVKNTQRADGWGEPGTDEVPEEYLVQVQHNMLVCALPVADVAVLIAGSDFRIYTVKADPDVQALLVKRESEFWSLVERGIPPAPKNASDVSALWGRSARSESIEATPIVASMIEALHGLRAERDRFESLIESNETLIKHYMAERDTLTVGGKVAATWKATAGRKSLDLAAIRAAHPALCEEFTKLGDPGRRFMLKG